MPQPIMTSISLSNSFFGFLWVTHLARHLEAKVCASGAHVLKVRSAPVLVFHIQLTHYLSNHLTFRFIWVVTHLALRIIN